MRACVCTCVNISGFNKTFISQLAHLINSDLHIYSYSLHYISVPLFVIFSTPAKIVIYSSFLYIYLFYQPFMVHVMSQRATQQESLASVKGTQAGLVND